MKHGGEESGRILEELQGDEVILTIEEKIEKSQGSQNNHKE